RAKGHAPDGLVLTTEGVEFRARQAVPDPYDAVGTGGGEPFPAGAIRHAQGPVSMSPQRQQVRMKESLEVVPLPLPAVGRAFIEQLFQPCEVAVPPARMRPGDVMEVEVVIGVFQRRLGSLALGLGVSACLIDLLVGSIQPG